MGKFDNTIILISKVVSYAGWILLTLCAVRIGWFKEEPPALMFDGALTMIGIGVALGFYRAARSIKDRK